MWAIGRHFEIVIQNACNISIIGNIDFVVTMWPMQEHNTIGGYHLIAAHGMT